MQVTKERKSGGFDFCLFWGENLLGKSSELPGAIYMVLLRVLGREPSPDGVSMDARKDAPKSAGRKFEYSEAFHDWCQIPNKLIEGPKKHICIFLKKYLFPLPMRFPKKR